MSPVSLITHQRETLFSFSIEIEETFPSLLAYHLLPSASIPQPIQGLVFLVS